MFLFLGAAAVATGMLSVGLEAAGRSVALGVAIAALAAMVLSYVRMAVMIMRAYGDEQAAERVRRYSPMHMAIVFAAPLVVTAAWPWGPASVAVGFAALMVCQFVFLHVGVAVTLVRQRRARRAPPAV
jgi:hypothetical protein